MANSKKPSTTFRFADEAERELFKACAKAEGFGENLQAWMSYHLRRRAKECVREHGIEAAVFAGK